MSRMLSISTVFLLWIFISTSSISAHPRSKSFDLKLTFADTSKLEGKIFNVAEEAPRFPGCKDTSDLLERDACARNKMLRFIYGNVKYPAEAQEKGIEGITAIRFIVASDGSLHDFEIVRQIGGGCDDEALRVIKSMPNWEPGLFKGEPVHTKYTVPIKFKLDNMPKKAKRSKG